MAPHSTFDNSGYMPSNAYFGQDQFKDLLPISKELGSITLQSGIKPFQLYAREDDSQGLRLSALEIQEIEQAVNTFQSMLSKRKMIIFDNSEFHRATSSLTYGQPTYIPLTNIVIQARRCQPHSGGANRVFSHFRARTISIYSVGKCFNPRWHV